LSTFFFCFIQQRQKLHWIMAADAQSNKGARTQSLIPICDKIIEEKVKKGKRPFKLKYFRVKKWRDSFLGRGKRNVSTFLYSC
jgi:hypothetical protein